MTDISRTLQLTNNHHKGAASDNTNFSREKKRLKVPCHHICGGT